MVSGKRLYTVQLELEDGRYVPKVATAEVVRETPRVYYFDERAGASRWRKSVAKASLPDYGLAVTPEEAIRLYAETTEVLLHRAEREYADALAEHAAALGLANQYGVSLKTEEPDGE